MKNYKRILCLCASLSVASLSLMSCSGGKQSGHSEQSSSIASTPRATGLFSADSAYQHIQAQVAFGPRHPGSQAHAQCADWIVAQLTVMGYTAERERFAGLDYHGQAVEGQNIITQLNPEASKRILLMAHWDTRPVADEDADPAKRKTPILGADDGASGVAVLLELARIFQAQAPSVGIDFIFFDLEDGGNSENAPAFCLGSEHWARTRVGKGYRADLGILLDMVGAKDAQFHYEGYSLQYAAHILHPLWKTASDLGWGKYFRKSEGGAITDDHVPIIQHLGIPCVDIVNYSPSRGNGFGTHWHTHADNLDIISTETLQAVGQTVEAYIRDIKE